MSVKIIDNNELKTIRNIWERKILRQRYTYLVSLPQSYIKNLGYDPKTVLMKLQEDGSIKLTAIENKNNRKEKTHVR